MKDTDDQGNPVRGDNESWYHYHLRWAFKWASEAGERRRIGAKSMVADADTRMANVRNGSVSSDVGAM